QLARVEGPRRDLEQLGAGRLSPLAHHGQSLSVPGQDRHGARMLDHLPGRVAPGGELHLVDAQAEASPLEGPFAAEGPLRPLSASYRPAVADRSNAAAGRSG